MCYNVQKYISLNEFVTFVIISTSSGINLMFFLSEKPKYRYDDDDDDDDFEEKPKKSNQLKQKKIDNNYLGHTKQSRRQTHKCSTHYVDSLSDESDVESEEQPRKTSRRSKSHYHYTESDSDEDVENFQTRKSRLVKL